MDISIEETDLLRPGQLVRFTGDFKDKLDSFPVIMRESGVFYNLSLLEKSSPVKSDAITAYLVEVLSPGDIEHLYVEPYRELSTFPIGGITADAEPEDVLNVTTNFPLYGITHKAFGSEVITVTDDGTQTTDEESGDITVSWSEDGGVNFFDLITSVSGSITYQTRNSEETVTLGLFSPDNLDDLRDSLIDEFGLDGPATSFIVRGSMFLFATFPLDGSTPVPASSEITIVLAYGIRRPPPPQPAVF